MTCSARPASATGPNPSDAGPASEFRYRNPVVDPDTLYVAVSQSGETTDSGSVTCPRRTASESWQACGRCRSRSRRSWPPRRTSPRSPAGSPGAEHVFFVGRVRGWLVAREGAQKLKEISYVHAEGYQGGELKHGPLALINAAMPSVVIVHADDLLAKNVSTIEQIKARSGPVIAVCSAVPRSSASAR